MIWRYADRRTEHQTNRSVGEYFWGGVLGTSFWIDPVEQLVTVAMMMAPERRLYYRHLLRPLVYGAIVGPVPD